MKMLKRESILYELCIRVNSCMPRSLLVMMVCNRRRYSLYRRAALFAKYVLYTKTPVLSDLLKNLYKGFPFGGVMSDHKAYSLNRIVEFLGTLLHGCGRGS